MLSIYGSKSFMVEEANLRKYLEVIVKDKSKMAIKSAAIVYDNGNVAARTSQFRISQEEFRDLKHAFRTPDTEKISFDGITYCVKSQKPTQLIAFNGSRYLIISRTETTYIIVTCFSRQFYSSLAAWINAVAKKIRERHS